MILLCMYFCAHGCEAIGQHWVCLSLTFHFISDIGPLKTWTSLDSGEPVSTPSTPSTVSTVHVAVLGCLCGLWGIKLRSSRLHRSTRTDFISTHFFQLFLLPCHCPSPCLEVNTASPALLPRRSTAANSLPLICIGSDGGRK